MGPSHVELPFTEIRKMGGAGWGKDHEVRGPLRWSCYWTSKRGRQVSYASIELKGVFPGGIKAREIWEPVFSM